MKGELYRRSRVYCSTIVTHRATTQDNEPMFEADDGDTK